MLPLLVLFMLASRRLIEGLCACEDTSGGTFGLAVTGRTTSADVRDFRVLLARETARRGWSRSPMLWCVAPFGARRARR